MKKSNVLWLVLSKNKQQQLSKIMKLTWILCVCFVCSLSANVMSQQRVNMNLGKTSIKTVFEEIRRQTGKIIIYNDDRLALERVVKADFKEADVRAVLDKVLAGSGMTYRFVDDYIVIVPEVKTTRDSTVKQFQIKGKVTDKKGEAIPGVTVRLDSTSLGAATDVNGEFSFDGQGNTCFFLYRDENAEGEVHGTEISERGDGGRCLGGGRGCCQWLFFQEQGEFHG